MADSQQNQTTLYPVFLDLPGRAALVVGGGRVAARKVAALRRAGARVTVVAAELCPQIQKLADEARVAVHRRGYRPDDIEGAWLVFAATDSEQTNRRVHDDCLKARVFCNIADQPELCTFHSPAVARRGPLQIAVSTGGASPAMASAIRKELEERYGPPHERLLDALARLREHYKAKHPADAARRGRLLKEFVACAAPRLLAEDADTDAIKEEIERWKTR